MPRDSASNIIAQVADALLAAESSRGLVQCLDELLELLHARPALLYMADGRSGVFYPAAGLGRESEDAPELPFPAAGEEHPPGHLPLHSQGEVVGLLAVPPEAASATLQRLAAMLGPVLMHLHRQESAQRDLRHSRQIIANLLAAGDLLLHLDLDVLLTKILETMLSAVQAQVGAVLTLDESGLPVPRVTWGLREDHLARIRTREGRPIAEQVLADGAPVCLNAEDLAAGALDLSGLDAHLTGLLALPLTSRNAVRGVVLLANPEGAFGDNQRRLAEMVCTLAAIALDNALLVKAMVEGERLRQELDLAKKVQEGMYPVGGLRLDRLAIEGGSRPCSETGGDYYTYTTRQGRALAMIGDVSGHGLGAALYTTMAHVIVQQQLRAGAALDPAFRQLNETLYHAQSGRFMTAALVEVDPADGAMRYVSAGHNPLLWIHQGEARWLESSGLPLGILAESEWPESALQHLTPGDTLVLYTDGFVEASDPAGEVWGDERFAAVLLEGVARGLGAAELMALVHLAVDTWSGGQAHADDLTLVVMRYG